MGSDLPKIQMQSDSRAILTITQYMTFPKEATQSAVEKVVVKIMTTKAPNVMPVLKRVILLMNCIRDILRNKKDIIWVRYVKYPHFKLGAQPIYLRPSESLNLPEI